MLVYFVQPAYIVYFVQPAYIVYFVQPAYIVYFVQPAYIAHYTIRMHATLTDTVNIGALSTAAQKMNDFSSL